MSNKRSAGAFCSIVVGATTGTFNSVAALDVVALGDGAECYCTANASVYRLNISSTQATVGSTFIKPNSGAGCWVLQTYPQSTYAQGVTAQPAFAGGSFSPTVNTWHALPSGTNFFISSPVSSSFWSLNTTTGVLTYSGPTGLFFLVTGQIVLQGIDDSQITEMDISVNGALIGGTTASQSSTSTTQPPSSGGFPMQLVHTYIVQGTNAATYQHILRAASTTPGLISGSHYQAYVTGL